MVGQWVMLISFSIIGLLAFFLFTVECNSRLLCFALLHLVISLKNRASFTANQKRNQNILSKFFDGINYG